MDCFACLQAQKALLQEDLSEALKQNDKLQESLCQADKMRAQLHCEIARLNQVTQLLYITTDLINTTMDHLY